MKIQQALALWSTIRLLLITRTTILINRLNEKITEFKSKETSSHLLKTFFIYGFIALSIIVTKVLIARLYGQKELGIFSYFFGLVSILFLFTSFGFPEAITQITIKRPWFMKKAIQQSLKWMIIPTILFTLPFLLFDNLLAKSDLKINLLVYIVMYTFFYLSYSIFRANKMFVEGSIYSLINRIAFIMIVISGFLFSWSFNSVLIGLSLALLLATILSLPKIISIWNKDALQRKNLGDKNSDISKENDDIRTEENNKEYNHDKEKINKCSSELNSKELIYLAFSLFLTQAGFYLLRETDLVVIPYLVDFKSLGVYSAHSSFSNIIRLIAYVFPVVMLPMAAVKNYKLKESLLKITKITVPFSLLVILATYIFVPVLYGKEYQNYLLPIVLVISSSLMIIYSFINSIFVGENKFSKFYLAVIGADFSLSLIAHTLLTIYFINLWGIIGAPLATIVAISLKIVVNYIALRRLRYSKEKTHGTDSNISTT